MAIRKTDYAEWPVAMDISERADHHIIGKLEENAANSIIANDGQRLPYPVKEREYGDYVEERGNQPLFKPDEEL